MAKYFVYYLTFFRQAIEKKLIHLHDLSSGHGSLRRFYKTELAILWTQSGNTWTNILLFFPITDMRRDVQEIFRATPHEKQVMMFSATLSKDIRPVCKKFMQDVRNTIPATSPRG